MSDSTVDNTIENGVYILDERDQIEIKKEIITMDSHLRNGIAGLQKSIKQIQDKIKEINERIDNIENPVNNTEGNN